MNAIFTKLLRRNFRSDECVRRHRRTKEVLIKSGAQIAPQIFRQIVQ